MHRSARDSDRADAGFMPLARSRERAANLHTNREPGSRNGERQDGEAGVPTGFVPARAAPQATCGVPEVRCGTKTD